MKSKQFYAILSCLKANESSLEAMMVTGDNEKSFECQYLSGGVRSPVHNVFQKLWALMPMSDEHKSY